MPKTVEYLEALGGIYFKGHHKEKCADDYVYLDERGLLLKEFGEQGWTTLFLEDFANWGLVRAGIRGFGEPPTDDYYRSTYYPLIYEKGLRGEHMRNDPIEYT